MMWGVGLFLVVFFVDLPPVFAAIRSDVGGNYYGNNTLEFRHSPFIVTKQIVVHPGANLTIEPGVTLEFDAGIGITVQGGVLHAVGSTFVGIVMQARTTPIGHDDQFPTFRLVDGPTTAQGRLQALFKGRWRGVCTMLTNWTDTDYNTACQSMGFGGGGFWQWYRRNNDTRPFVLPRPGCQGQEKSLWKCPQLVNEYNIQLSENLCQGEDDLGLVCWGPPSFGGWSAHWRGITFLESPWHLEPADDHNGVEAKRVSNSRLEWITIQHAGYNGDTKNVTAGIYARGVPPVMNYINVFHSAGDGIFLHEPDGPAQITNSTINYNRGHGLVVMNTTDGRLFVNQTRIQFNFGDGIQYSRKHGLSYNPYIDLRRDATMAYFEPEKPDINLCDVNAKLGKTYYPYLVEVLMENGTYIPRNAINNFPCRHTFRIPRGLTDYTYTVQFLDSVNLNPPALSTNTSLHFCTTGPNCKTPDYVLPVLDGVLPPSISLPNKLDEGLWIGMDHDGAPNNQIFGTIRMVMRIHAQVKGQVIYGLNVSNSLITDNLGSGVMIYQMRDKTIVDNVTISNNQGTAGIHVYDGVGDVWINNTRLYNNWGDGINISYTGGSIVINGTSTINSTLRGFAFNHNDTRSPFYALSHEITIKGRPANSDATPAYISGNKWGGILIGNFCRNNFFEGITPKVLISYVAMNENQYHPAFEYHSCQRDNQPTTDVEMTGSRCQWSNGMCVRIQPAVNIDLRITDNRFLNNDRTAMIIRNREHPQLAHLPAKVALVQNQFKKNRGNFIVNIGLNEDAPLQSMMVNGQNEIRDNEVIDPYPVLNARNRPFAAMVVSSSNVILQRNCFHNVEAKYEIATDLTEHAKVIEATENAWGATQPEQFMLKIFDGTKRYNLAKFKVDPYAILCNSHNPQVTRFYSYIPPYADPQDPSRLGGLVYESVDLSRGTYTVFDDLHILPGARLSIEPGTILNFESSIGMLVQGELLRMFSVRDTNQITFTTRDLKRDKPKSVRLVDDEGLMSATNGRLEVSLDDGRSWGTVCNRSWTVDLAAKVCNQLGLIVDPEFIENWFAYPKNPGPNPIIMDNIWCEELETDITKCRHDGIEQAVNVSCPVANVVGVRCVEPRWAGVRYTLLANPPSVTGQDYIHHVTIERAGLLDYTGPVFSAALQIDWNYHTFSHLTIRDNFWNGLDIVYNDLVKKPKIEHSKFLRNRRHGIRARSYGLTIMHCRIEDNQNAGIRYNPILSANLQRDVVTWLKRDDLTEDQILHIPVKNNLAAITISISDSGGLSRKFLVANTDPTACVPSCRQRYLIRSNSQGSNFAKIGIHVINRPSNLSDETMIIRDGQNSYNLRDDLIKFPIVSRGSSLQAEYSRSFGPAALIILVFYHDAYLYLDPFIHVGYSRIAGNQYAISTLHYSNFTHNDGSIINRYKNEKLWFQQIHFEANKHAVIWVNGPLRDASIGNPIANITYDIDNCTMTRNNGSVIETHRDLYQSANVFSWRVWRCYFIDNENSGFAIALPDTYDRFAPETNRFEFLENLIHQNHNFEFQLSGYFVWMNVSANNFTYNKARPGRGLMRIIGMEKELIMERNRWERNQAKWVLLWEIYSQTVRLHETHNENVPANINNCEMIENYFLGPDEPLVDHYPRSFAIGIRGLQKVNISYNVFRNDYLDFEAVVGLRGAPINDVMNVTYNYWGRSLGVEISQRIFDFDDWNIFSTANYNPFMVTNEYVRRWDWSIRDAQIATYQTEAPSVYDLKGRLTESVTLERKREKWTYFPFDYKPDRPYRISKDLTIMPGVTLTIEKGVEVHLYPGVRILVLGSLKADGTELEPILFRPINVTEVKERGEDPRILYEPPPSLANVTTSRRSRRQSDIIYSKFPLLHREDTFYQKFNVMLTQAKMARSGFLEIYNSTTGEQVPICDRQFTRRNGEVVCRELGYETRNVYVWIGPRWDYNPRLRIVRSYAEPRQCYGDEARLSECDLRLNGDRDLWYCSSSEYFVFIHCGQSRIVNDDYVAHWGGITFSAPSVESPIARDSILRHVEIVGAGAAHNQTDTAALELIFQSPILERVNITNSSMHAVTVIAPRGPLQLKNANITHNLGAGLNILTLNLQGTSQGTGASEVRQNLTIPYHIFGMLDMCSVGKEVVIKERVLLYYKYDSYAVDCLKIFRSEGNLRNVGFRFLQVNMYNSHDYVGRPDTLTFYNHRYTLEKHKIARIYYDSESVAEVIKSDQPILTLYLRANAADGNYGFIAEVFSLPTSPEKDSVEKIVVRDSRFEYNDRGALEYSSIGEKVPNVDVEQCFFGRNGYHVWGNFTTSQQAIRLTLHNTLSLKFQNNMLWKNQGGLRISASSTTSNARLEGVIMNSAFSQNYHWETLVLEGKDYQQMTLTNNYFGKNRAPYRDVVLVDQLLANFSYNIFYNNTGTHIVDMTGYRKVDSGFQGFHNNFMYDNVALGHGYQFSQTYGFLPQLEYDYLHEGRFRVGRRKKRDGESGTSFEWWAHVGGETERYRSTILAGNAQQMYSMNYLINPANDFELTTVLQSPTDSYKGAVVAKNNWWGYPGTPSVATGRIRDKEDYPYLINVDYTPVLQTNATLLDVDCPPGWFHTGQEEPTKVKSCFLFVGGAVPYHEAHQFCVDNDGFMPYFRHSDPRMDLLIAKLRMINEKFRTKLDRYFRDSGTTTPDLKVWISGVMISPQQCGYLSAQTGDIAYHNCQEMLPFVCEQGPDFRHWFLLSPAGIAAIILVILLLLLIILIVIFWCVKSRRRKRQYFERKNSLRDSIRSLRELEKAKEQQNRLKEMQQAVNQTKPRPPSPDIVGNAHARMVLGDSFDSSFVHDRTTTPSLTESKNSLLTDSSTNSATFKPPAKSSKPSLLTSESAYRSDYSPSIETSTDTTSYYNVPESRSVNNVKSPLMPPQTPPKPPVLSQNRKPSQGSIASLRTPSKKHSPVPAPQPKVPGGGHPKGSGRRHPSLVSTTSTCTSCPSCSCTNCSQRGEEDLRSLSTIKSGEASDTCSCTDHSIVSSVRSSSSTLAQDSPLGHPSDLHTPRASPQSSGGSIATADSGMRYAPMTGATPLRQFQVTPDSFTEEKVADYMQDSLSPLRPVAGGQRARPRPLSQGLNGRTKPPPMGYPNMAYASSPSYDSLLSPSSPDPPNNDPRLHQPPLTSFSRTVSTPDASRLNSESKGRKKLPMETAM